MVGKKNKTLTSFSFVEISELEVKGLILFPESGPYLSFLFHRARAAKEEGKESSP